MRPSSGCRRGIFSNEAGLGSAPIAHAAADVNHPVEQGIYGVFEVFMDTIVVCSMTSLVVLLAWVWTTSSSAPTTGAALTIQGFTSVFSGAIPGIVVAVCLTLFALSTILTWGLYGTRCWEFLLGHKASKVYQVIFSLIVIVGATMELQIAWNIADTLNGLMAIPNLIAVFLLAPVVAKLTKEYFTDVRQRSSASSVRVLSLLRRRGSKTGPGSAAYIWERLNIPVSVLRTGRLFRAGPFRLSKKSCQTFSQPKKCRYFPTAEQWESPHLVGRTPCAARLCGAFDWIRGGLCPLELPLRCAAFYF